TLGLSDQELMALVQISYIDWDFIGVDVRGLTVLNALEIAELRVADFPPENGGFSQEEFRIFIERVIADEGTYGQLRSLTYLNHVSYRPSERMPQSDTLSMAALEDGNGNRIILMTGTEGAFDGYVTGQNDFLTAGWIDNFMLGMGKVDQSIAMRIAAFMETYSSSSTHNLALGHSRGFALALRAALSSNGRINVLGIQGFPGSNSFTEEELAFLNDIAENWAAAGDFVSSIGRPVGKQRYWQVGPGITGYRTHRTDAFAFDEKGRLMVGTPSFFQRFVQNVTIRVLSRDPEVFHRLLAILDEGLTPLGRTKAPMRYVVAGAKLKCDYGLRTSQLLMPESKGVYIHDLPQATLAHNQPEHVIAFGGCSSCKNPTTQKVKAELADAKDELSRTRTGRRIGGAVSLKDTFLNTIYGTDGGTVYGECMFQTSVDWIDPKSDVLLNGERALLRRCALPCLYGGTITIEDDGQQD
ncbi:MAG: DUF4280 domain-containing protein, partial [Defluviitaleaceae bacterium]|nr:DUF4280 domain-containing protein [Defluviitaleaceae bacterium]